MGVRHACRDSGRPVAREAEEQTRELFANSSTFPIELACKIVLQKGTAIYPLTSRWRTTACDSFLPTVPVVLHSLLACLHFPSREDEFDDEPLRDELNAELQDEGSSVIFIAASHAISVM